MLHSTVFNTSQICHQLGVKHAVLSPGSRNAPLTISFARQEKIKKWIIPDERTAGFIALGIAQQVKSPVVLCCTSGTALLNYAPAIAEAYYREIPLIVLSADRPPELIDQRDGQTIRQFEVLKNHVKASIQLPLVRHDKDADIYASDLIHCLRMANELPRGPIHINVPFKEPFYPNANDELNFQPIDIQHQEHEEQETGEEVQISSYANILILIGQQPLDEELNRLLGEISQYVPVLKFPLNNIETGIEFADLFIDQHKDLKPDLLITSGLSVLSKKMKTFLRVNKPSRHLHIDPAGIEVDTYESNPEMQKCSLSAFLNVSDFSQANVSFREKWEVFSNATRHALNDVSNAWEFSESLVAQVILKSIPDGSNLHLSNSMPVRYADMFGVPNKVECYSNRGTSGIDGCTSTAFGTAMVSDKLNILMTGDLAFLYDRNAFFHNHPINNLRIIILNNQGGGIFRLIDGPSNLPELETYFETRHNRTAKYICAENGLDYAVAHDMDTLKAELAKFFEPSNQSKVIEVFTDPETNQKVYKKLKNYINERVKN